MAPRAKKEAPKTEETAVEVVTNAEVVEDENIYRLLKPIDGLPDRFIFDLESLKGDAILRAESMYNREKVRRKEASTEMVKELSKEYLLYIVAIAIGWKPEDVRQMSARDFTTLTIRAQNFLLGM